MRVQGTNLIMTRGDSENIAISCEVDGKQFIEDGDTVYFTIKKSTRTKEKLFQKVITVFSNNNAIVEFRPEDTKDLPYGSYRYDIQVTKSNGVVKTIVKPSSFVIEEEVTYE